MVRNMARFNLYVIPGDIYVGSANSITYARRKAVATLKEETYADVWYEVEIREGMNPVGTVEYGVNDMWMYTSRTKSGGRVYRLFPFGNIIPLKEALRREALRKAQK